jgi:transcriptional regulator NrdR family protein
MSIGHPKRDEDKLQQTLRTLETKLKEKEEDILLAAQVGQSLLEEIDRVSQLAKLIFHY